MKDKSLIPYSHIICLIVFAVFLIAKLYGNLDWSWWWIFSPIWIPLALIGVILLLMGIVWIGAAAIDKFI